MIKVNHNVTKNLRPLVRSGRLKWTAQRVRRVSPLASHNRAFLGAVR